MSTVAFTEIRTGTRFRWPESFRPSRLMLTTLGVAWLGLVMAVLPIGKAIHKPASSGNKDYSLWYSVGRSIAAGEPLYRCEDSTEVQYTYPPTFAVLILAPVTQLGYVPFVAIFALANALAWAASVYMTQRLVAGGNQPSWWEVVLPTLATAAYVWDMFHLGQVNLILLSLVLGSALALQRRWPNLAGALLGVTIAIKVFPLPILVYFAARREWRAISAAVACVGLLAVGMPAALRGVDRTLSELNEWSQLMVGDQSGGSMAARSSIGFSWRNSSVVSVAHRLLREIDAGEKDGVPFRINVATFTPQTAQMTGYVVCLLLGAVLLGVTRLRFAPTRTAEGLEWGMVLALTVLCSPLSWTYFFCWLLPGWAAVVRIGLRTRLLWAILASTLAGVLLALAGAQLINPIFSAYGTTTWGAIVLYLTMAGLRWREGRLAIAGEEGWRQKPR